MIQQSDTIVKSSHNAHGADLQAACAEILDRLQGAEHTLVNDQHGCHLEAKIQPLLGMETVYNGTKPGTSGMSVRFTRSMEPVVQHLLREKGYSIQSAAAVAGLPAADLDAVQGRGVVDDSILALVRRCHRGIVRCGPQVDLAWVLVQIAWAYPALSIVIASARVDEVSQIAAQVRQWLPDDVKLVRSGSIIPGPKRIVIGTYQGLLGGCMDINRRGLLIALDAVEILGKLGLELLNAATNARLLGFLPDDRKKMAPRDADHVRSFFGFQECHIPLHGYKSLPVDVVFEKIIGRQVSADTGSIAIRNGIWHDHLRNRRIQKLARYLQENDQQGLTQFKKVYRATEGRDTRRTAVLVENVEHGLKIARKLPGWPLIAGPDVYLQGLKRQDQELFQSIAKTSSDNAHGIFTITAIDRLDPRKIDVLIRADAGIGLPPIDNKRLLIPNTDQHRLLLIDFDDRRHHDLRVLTRRRKKAYDKRGWYRVGADPVEERVKDFLAARPKG